MSDWAILNAGRISLPGYPDTDASWGFNGAFGFWIEGCKHRLLVIASDGDGWQHVSVSFPDSKHTIPNWEVMCRVKDLFFEPEDTVVQFHPAKNNYVNYHGGCLHLWKPIGREFPIPDPILVGPKSK